METKEQYMVTPVMDFAETVKMINKMKVNVESNISLVNQLQANIVTLQESTAHGLVVHDGKVLVQVEREAREGDYVVFENLVTLSTINGKFYEVVERFGKCKYEDENFVYRYVDEWGGGTYPKVYEVIGNLPQSDVVAAEKKCKHLTANQKRARVIQMAKEFVEDQKGTLSGLVIDGDRGFKKYEDVYSPIDRKTGFKAACNAEFVRKGNRVTCVLKGADTEKVYAVGRSECHVDDVFNEHIGQAVALAKALDIVEQLPPDILNAVQPNKVVVGQRVKTSDGEVFVHGFEKCSMSERMGILVDYLFGNREDGFTWLPNEGVDIIDDTNADYSLQGGEN